MNLNNKIKYVQKTIRYLANFLLLISIIYILVSLFTIGFLNLDVMFYLQLLIIWQVVIMLILTENFYLVKKLK